MFCWVWTGGIEGTVLWRRQGAATGKEKDALPQRTRRLRWAALRRLWWAAYRAMAHAGVWARCLATKVSLC